MRRSFLRLLSVLSLLLTLCPVVPVGADSDSSFTPAWVANYRPATLWSGVDDQAVAFGPLAQFTPLLALGVAGSRLLVLSPTSEGTGYVDADRVGPVGAPFPAVLFSSVTGGQRLVHVELAQTPEEWSSGLMGRQSLPPDSGMLFVFPDGETVGFWMKDTPLPLSIAFIDGNGSVLSVQDMQPFSTENHFAPAPYHYALEVAQGYFAAQGITVGATATLTLPS